MFFLKKSYFHKVYNHCIAKCIKHVKCKINPPYIQLFSSQLAENTGYSVNVVYFENYMKLRTDYVGKMQARIPVVP